MGTAVVTPKHFMFLIDSSNIDVSTAQFRKPTQEESFLTFVGKNDRKALSQYIDDLREVGSIIPRFLLQGLLEELGFDIIDFDINVIKFLQKIFVSLTNTLLVHFI